VLHVFNFFSHNALMYVSLIIKNNFSNVLNDIDVVYKSILLKSIKISFVNFT
jgi:hypothetical protein